MTTQARHPFLYACSMAALVMLFSAANAAAQIPCGPTYWVDGQVANEAFGHEVSYAGDVNNDGNGDFIVATWYDQPGADGWTYVFSGPDGSPIWSVTETNDDGDIDLIGSHVSGGADWNGDGFSDFFVGSVRGEKCISGTSNPGHMMVYDGQTGLAARCLEGIWEGRNLGSSMSPIPDIDGDGFDDIVVAGQYFPECCSRRGQVFVYSPLQDPELDTGFMEGTTRVYTGLRDIGLLGWSVATLGDVNDDGVPDIAASAPSPFWTADFDTGFVYVFSGAASETIIWTQQATRDSTRFGNDVANIGDVNGDGKDDIVVGEPWNSTASTKGGAVHAYSGADGTLLWSQVSALSNIGLGWAVSGAGDVNDDGIPDVAVGAPYYLGNGRVYFYSGSTGAFLFTLTAQVSGEDFGSGVASGDLNNDGIDDIMVGARANPAQGPVTGRVYVYLMGDPDDDGTTVGCDNCPYLANPAQEDLDGDNWGDSCDNCLLVANSDQSVTIVTTGDVNLDGVLTSADIIFKVNFIFKGGADPEPCPAASDVNCAGATTSADIIYMVNHVFKGGAAPCNICTESTTTWFCL